MNSNATMCTPLQFTTNAKKTYSVSAVNLPTLFNNCEQLGIATLQDIDSCINQATRLMINGATNRMPLEDFTRLLKFIEEISFMFKESFAELPSDCPHHHI